MMTTRAQELLESGNRSEQADVVAAFLESEGWPTYAEIVRRLALSSPSDETLRGALEEIYEVRQKLVALRRMVEAAGQPFYEEILNEVIPVLARAHDAALTRTAEPEK